MQANGVLQTHLFLSQNPRCARAKVVDVQMQLYPTTVVQTRLLTRERSGAKKLP